MELNRAISLGILKFIGLDNFTPEQIQGLVAFMQEVHDDYINGASVEGSILTLFKKQSENNVMIDLSHLGNGGSGDPIAGVGITNIVAGDSVVGEEFTTTPVTVSLSSGMTKSFSVQAKNGSKGDEGLGIKNIETTINGNVVTLTTTYTDDTTSDTTFDIPASTTPVDPVDPVTTSYRIFTQDNNTLPSEIVIEGADLIETTPIKKILQNPRNYLVIAFTHDISDIHINILESAELPDNIQTSALGNRYIASQVQIVGKYKIFVLNIESDISLLEPTEKIGVYVG